MIYKKVVGLNKAVSEEISKREDYFINKSEKWQDSEAGDKYSVVTDIMRELKESLDEAEINLPKKS